MPGVRLTPDTFTGALVWVSVSVIPGYTGQATTVQSSTALLRPEGRSRVSLKYSVPSTSSSSWMVMGHRPCGGVHVSDFAEVACGEGDVLVLHVQVVSVGSTGLPGGRSKRRS